MDVGLGTSIRFLSFNLLMSAIVWGLSTSYFIRWKKKRAARRFTFGDYTVSAALGLAVALSVALLIFLIVLLLAYKNVGRNRTCLIVDSAASVNLKLFLEF
jgi:hypothetical protein